jgi:thiamine biosynthesis protein ThiS
MSCGIHITVNGQTRGVPAGATVRTLLTELKLEPIRVAVEINEGLVPRRSFEATQIHDGDRVEIVTLVGGG